MGDRTTPLQLKDLGAPVWISALLERIRLRGPGRATAGEWVKFVLAATEHGISQDEVRSSCVLLRLLGHCNEDAALTRSQMLDELQLAPCMPRLQLMVDESFLPSTEWSERAVLIKREKYRELGLFGKWPTSWYVERHRHPSLGWSVVLANHSDLVHPARRWWLAMTPEGYRAPGQPLHGYATASEAKAHAAKLMVLPQAKSAKARHTPNWTHLSLNGFGPYIELLITMPAWGLTFYSPVHFPGVRNLLVHLRANVCRTDDARLVLFLDEVQSDWHAELIKQSKNDVSNKEAQATPVLPFSREWPLLALKFALWWAADQGLAGVSWSPPELHEQRWQEYRPPTEVYRRGLPDAAARLARVLSLTLSPATMLRRRVLPANPDRSRWLVTGKDERPLSKPFATLEQANRFADALGAIARPQTPVLWLNGPTSLKRMPLFGTGDALLWGSSP